MLSIIIRQYVFCLCGAFLRYLYAYVFKRQVIQFKEVWDYEKHPENEITDAILGFLVIGITCTIIFTV